MCPQRVQITLQCRSTVGPPQASQGASRPVTRAGPARTEEEGGMVRLSKRIAG